MPTIVWMVLAAGSTWASAPIRNAPDESAQAQYARKFIGIDEYSVSGGSDYFVAYQGKYKRPLEGADFYEAIARPDLASSYRTRAFLKTTFRIAGPVASAFGVLYAFGLFHSCGSFDDGCVHTRTYVGLGILGGGVVLNAIGYLLSPDPISRSKARELVEGYDRDLKHRLGLDDDDAPAPAPVVAALIPVRGGATAAIAWTF